MSRLLWVLLVLTSLCAGGDGLAASADETKGESTVVLYGTMSAPDLNRLVQAFEKKYPAIKVQSFRANSERVLNRVMTEARTGSYFADVINLDGVNGWILKDKGLLQSHKSAETEAFPEQFRDPEGFLPCCIYVVTNVIGYNTSLVGKNDVPRSYADLLEPKWTGKLGMDADEGEWFAGLISVWGRERSVNYFKALMKQRPSLHRGHTLLAQLNAAGEFAVAVNLFGYRPLEMQSQGAPIDIVNADPVIARPWGLSLARRAPHPNAGRLLIDFALSTEGQKLIASYGRTVVRPGVPQKFPRLVEGVKLHPVRPELGKDHAEISKLYYSIVK